MLKNMLSQAYRGYYVPHDKDVLSWLNSTCQGKDGAVPGKPIRRLLDIDNWIRKNIRGLYQELEACQAL